MSSSFDAALGHLRDLCKARRADRADVTVRQDGRVSISLLDADGNVTFQALTFAGDSPNSTLHGVFAEWDGQ